MADWLWEAACVIRGAIDAPKFKDYILPLIFMKRLSDVFEDELKELGDIAKFVDDDHSLVRFYVPPDYRWGHLARMTTGLGEALADSIRALERENDKLKGVFGSLDFNATAAGQRILSDDQIRALIRILSRYRLGLKDVESDVLGDAYMQLIKKFAEGQGSSAEGLAGEWGTGLVAGEVVGNQVKITPGIGLRNVLQPGQVPSSVPGGSSQGADWAILHPQGPVDPGLLQPPAEFHGRFNAPTLG